MKSSPSSRRQFLKSGAAGAAALGLTPLGLTPLGSSQELLRGTQQVPASVAQIKLGVASYSLRKFNRKETIKMTNELGVDYINIKSFHLRHEDSPKQLKAGRKEIEDAGLQIVGGGTITMREDTDEAIRPNFEYAKMCGMPLMVIAPTPEVMPRIEKFVKEYDIKVAVHNHGPEDKYFPAPSDVLAVIDGMDARVGCCVDVGHTVRTGVDIVEAIAEAGDRVLDMHMKDLSDLMVKESQVAVGEGNMPVARIFKQLLYMDYQGYVNLEYEIFADNPLPGMKQSFAYMRGVMAGMGL
ncbi:MAG: sugar phosphate isomerase/epimerase family protein [Rhodothermales bacterium]